MEFSWDALEGQNRRLADLRRKMAAWTPGTEERSEAATALDERFRAAVADDLDLPRALVVLNETVGSAVPDAEKYGLLASWDRILGLDLERDAREGWEPTESARARGGTDAAPTASFATSDAMRTPAGDGSRSGLRPGNRVRPRSGSSRAVGGRVMPERRSLPGTTASVLPAVRVVASTGRSCNPHAGARPSFDVERSGSALLIAAQMHDDDDEVGLALWPNPGADDRPQVIHRPPGQAASPHAAGQSHPGLRAIEGEVPALVLDDGVQQVDELGVVRLRDQPVVRREGGSSFAEPRSWSETKSSIGRAEHRADMADLPTTESATDPQVPRGAGRIASPTPPAPRPGRAPPHRGTG
jgi:hypothetical protein